MTGQLIAIVDDEMGTVTMLSTFLRLKGFEVRSALSGSAGLDLVRTERPAALLLDYMLPDINGFEVCKQLRADPEFKSLPIVIISAHSGTTNAALALEAGANLYLSKPLRLPDLLATLQDLLGGA
ncbi:MAG TPA: response regulator [Aggregatilinea sp.]|uniref:response regulator n=1 Tax=Aggregatilinea sp. TaxID=2806333 RepID=UPI002BE14B97|nr:response regulator [Aggregatilinea sp.]HML24770.1 response regulator [Aggregatilinea sp.]